MNFLETLHKIGSRRALTFFVVLFILTITALPSIQESSSYSTGSPDMSLFYTIEELYMMAGSYGEEGRNNYIFMRFTFDLVFPLIYGGSLISSLSWLYNIERLLKWRNQVVLLPFGAVIFDYFENIATSIVMWRYPMRVDFVGFLAPVFTPVKWGLLSSAFVLLVPGLIIRISRARLDCFKRYG